MSDKQETKMTLRESYAHAQLEDEAFDREFECCRKMKSAKPEPAPCSVSGITQKFEIELTEYQELLERMNKAERSLISQGFVDNGAKYWKPPVNVKCAELRKERDDLKERCGDLDLQVDSLEAQLSKLNLENVTLKDTVVALKECESVKGQVSEPVEWNGEGLPPVNETVEYHYHEGEEWRSGVSVAIDGGKVVVRDSEDDGYTGCYAHNIRKPESPEQKAQREREEAAYDLFALAYTTVTDRPPRENSFAELQRDTKDMYLAIVDKTGYRKQP